MQHACTRAACSCTWRARRLHVLKENLRLYDSRSTIFTKTSNVSRISNVSRTPLFAIAFFCKKTATYNRGNTVHGDESVPSTGTERVDRIVCGNLRTSHQRSGARTVQCCMIVHHDCSAQGLATLPRHPQPH